MGRYAGYARTGSGIYTPEPTAVLNISEQGGIVMRPAMFLRIGDIVHVAGEFDLTPVLAVGTTTRFRFTLPNISSDVNAEDIAGICSSGVVANAGAGRIRGARMSGQALVDILSQHTNLQTYTYVFMYVVR